MARFDGRKILVTGGTSGIGLATAKRLSEEGAKLLLTGHSQKHIEEAQAALPKAKVIENDASAHYSAEALAECVREFAPEGLDGAFLNAGFGRFKPLGEIDATEIDDHFDLNLRAPLLQAKHLGPCMKDGGAILLVSSGTVGGGRADTLVYSASKAAVRQAARSLATEFAPRGIRVNVVTPGLTESRFHERGGMSEEAEKSYKEKVAQAVPLGRLGTPEDIAGVATFLLSEDAAYVTGSEYRVDGGLTMA
ncbi:SDR family oxidoreductase [Stakelama sp. CBK3Z-3]|uniref:SDR family oxidoreductase n=1 Tax=Stakelama flava TaxID=2860338 RepID=A0ABS6XMZ9_9SPHN|nr:SDR family oxidoreductase [Stakelama flava]MBW4331153.1 SDR family oxidoreductase [Stakelama flava]